MKLSHVIERWFPITAVAVVLLSVLVSSPRISAQENNRRDAAKLFGTLPNGASGPEGLTVGTDGNVYVATFGFNQNGSVTGLGQLYYSALKGIFSGRSPWPIPAHICWGLPFILTLAFCW
jgi:hypothetical protein